MARYTSYTNEFKDAMIQKLLTSTNKSVSSLSREAGIPISTLKNWKNKYCQNKGIVLSKNKLKPEEKFNIVILTASMSEAEKNEYCRKNGIYPEDIERWKEDCITACAEGSGTKSKRDRKAERKLEQETKRLKKELTRKEKALAETAALLVLKKKADALWGGQEDE
jgi:transposase-like protein